MLCFVILIQIKKCLSGGGEIFPYDPGLKFLEN